MQIMKRSLKQQSKTTPTSYPDGDSGVKAEQRIAIRHRRVTIGRMVHSSFGMFVMPSRPITALIVLFWLGTLGCFGYRDIWPKFWSGDAPPFVIELADEAISQGGPNRLRS